MLPELTVLERAERLQEWIGLTNEKEKPARVAQVSAKGGRGEGGLSASVRELKIKCTAAEGRSRRGFFQLSRQT